MEFHWKVIIQAKGFLKIVEFLLALITFSILAGYGPSVEISTCTFNSINVSTQFSTHYPFDILTVQRTNLTSNQPLADTRTDGTPTMISAGRQASFFVAWGVLTLFYCIIAVVVYITTMAEAERLGKVYHVLCYTQLGFTIFWCFMWFIASAEWAAGQNKLGGELQAIALAKQYNDCSNIDSVRVVTPYSLIVLQSAIAVVFGFLNVFVWFCNIWWVLKDCPAFIAWQEKRSNRSSSNPYQQ